MFISFCDFIFVSEWAHWKIQCVQIGAIDDFDNIATFVFFSPQVHQSKKFGAKENVSLTVPFFFFAENHIFVEFSSSAVTK